MLLLYYLYFVYCFFRLYYVYDGIIFFFYSILFFSSLFYNLYYLFLFFSISLVLYFQNSIIILLNQLLYVNRKLISLSLLDWSEVDLSLRRCILSILLFSFYFIGYFGHDFIVNKNK